MYIFRLPIMWKTTNPMRPIPVMAITYFLPTAVPYRSRRNGLRLRDARATAVPVTGPLLVTVCAIVTCAFRERPRRATTGPPVGESAMTLLLGRFGPRNRPHQERARSQLSQAPSRRSRPPRFSAISPWGPRSLYNPLAPGRAVIRTAPEVSRGEIWCFHLLPQKAVGRASR